jgi:hypothetical protein
MDERLFDAVEVCLAALRTGVELDACLALYPDLANELRPILAASLAARQLGHIPLPSPSTENRSRARFLSAAAAIDIQSKPKFSWAALRRAALVALVVLVAFAVSWNGLLVASAKSLPGDVLYPVKRVSERVNLRLMPNMEEKHQYESDFNLRRAEEVKLLLDLGRVEHVSYEGTVTEITPDRWVVGGFSVFISADTIFVGSPKIGQFVEVEGQSQPGGWVNAQEIHLRYFQYAGEVEQIEQDFWTISGTQLDLSPNVQLDPGLHVHDQALALVQSNDDGKLTALAITGVPDDIQFSSQDMEIILEGWVENISDANWLVAGRNVRIDPQTLIAANVVVGDMVRVYALANWDGSLTANRIELLLKSQSAPLIQPEQKYQDPGLDLFSDKSEKYDQIDPGASLDQAETENETQNTVVEEEHNEPSSQVESSGDHEDADQHQEDDGEHHNEDKHKEDDHKDDGSSSDHPEIDD